MTSVFLYYSFIFDQGSSGRLFKKENKKYYNRQLKISNILYHHERQPKIAQLLVDGEKFVN